MRDLVPIDPTDSHGVVIAVLHKIVSATGIAVTTGAVVKSFGGAVRYIENQASFFVDRQIRISDTRKNFMTITKALEQGTDSTARGCFNFCMRVHHLPDTEKKFIFMGMVASAFQRDWVGTINRFSKMEEDIVQNYFGNFRGQ